MREQPFTSSATLTAPRSDADGLVFQRERRLRTTGAVSARDITDEVSEAVRASGITAGIASVYSPHTTCCIRVTALTGGLLEDFARLLARLVPSDRYYAHDDWSRRTENVCPEDDTSPNGHAHCMAMLLGPAGESLAVRDGALCLGPHQRVLFVELDRARQRRWLVSIVGR